jgi:Flp pilus assembly protein TadD
MDAQELATAAPEYRDSLIHERNRLWGKSEESIRRAQTILVDGRVPSTDSYYRMVMIGTGNIIFGREIGASNEEKRGYYRQALSRYQDAAALFPDDPRPLLYQGFCYERLTDIARKRTV